MTHFQFSNRRLAVAIGAFALAYLVVAVQIPDFALGGVTVQPGTLPSALGLLLLGLSAALFFQPVTPVPAAEPTAAEAADTDQTAAVGGAGPATAQPPATLGRLTDIRHELGLFLLSMIVYVALLVPVGFAVSTALYISGMAWYLGYRRHLVNIAVGVGLSAGLQLGVVNGLGIALPSGPFGW